MSHTKVKLTARGDLVCDSSGDSLWDYHGKSQAENEANTRRLVACWNALDGVPTEWLENYVAGGVKNLLQENAELKAENERLKAAQPFQKNPWKDLIEFECGAHNIPFNENSPDDTLMRLFNAYQAMSGECAPSPKPDALDDVLAKINALNKK